MRNLLILKKKLDMEKPPKLEGDKEVKLNIIRERVNEIADALNKPIDEGIKEAVVMFNVFGLRTTASCEGHPRAPRTKERQPAIAPWIDVGPEEPDKPDWTEDEELREKVYRKTREYKRKAMGLLGEFYERRKVPYDAMLGYGAGYWFRMESYGVEFLGDLPEAERLEKYKLYKKEMDDFAEFLREKYFSQ